MDKDSFFEMEEYQIRHSAIASVRKPRKVANLTHDKEGFERWEVQLIPLYQPSQPMIASGDKAYADGFYKSVMTALNGK